jgi:hypothetical protein
MKMARARQTPGQPRCLIVERHEWETGATQRQLQFVLETAEEIFGPGNTDRRITARVFLDPTQAVPSFTKTITISRVYGPSATRRTNGFREIGSVPSAFVFFQETTTPGTYDVWWQTDKAIVAAHFHGWIKGRDSQHGRGRLSIVVGAPVPRPIDDVP